MKTRVIRREAAKRDLDRQAEFIARDNIEAAIRFLEAAEQSFKELARKPGLGAPYQCGIEGVRKWRVRGFENCLVFYCAVGQGIEVLRVVHGARDLHGLFED